MSKQRPVRIVYLLAVCIALLFIGRNLYRRYLNHALVDAIKDRNASAVRRLLELGADPNYRFSIAGIDERLTPPEPMLYLALSEDGDPLAVPTIASRMQPGPPNANAQKIFLMLLQHGAHWQDMAYLAEACRDGDVVITRELLTRGADPNAPVNSTALRFAIEYAADYQTVNMAPGPEKEAEEARRKAVRLSLVHLLEEHGAHVTLAQAQVIGDAPTATRIIADMGPGTGAEGAFAMSRAAYDDDLKTLNQLLSKKVDPNQRPRFSQLQPGFIYDTPLHAAVTRNHVDAIKLLLAHGADPNFAWGGFGPFMGGETPLAAAARMGNLELVQLLLVHGADIDNDRSGSTSALEAAVSSRHPALARYLLAHGANAAVRTRSPYPLLTIALRDLPELVPDLLKHEAPVNSEVEAEQANALPSWPPPAPYNSRPPGQPAGPPLGQPGAPPLRWMREQHLNSGMAPFSPLMAALFYAPQYEETLAARGAKIGSDRPIICMTAALRHRLDLLPKLLAYGADINGVDASRDTALSICVASMPEAVQTLLEQGANPNVLSHDLRTPLQQAALLGRTEQVRLLLAHGANVNARVDRGHTALFWARKKNHADIVALLLQAGATQ
jgi:ankyrin repeat protein